MSARGRIFDMQRCSFVDGPGIRTVVFFKGCNLNCAWCHNPESKSANTQMLYFKNRCTACGKCVQACPNGAIRSDLSRDTSKCVLCGKCSLVCHADARSMCGREIDSDEIMSKCKKDASYYRNSDGGVTFSGGECMLQMGFLTELLERCHVEKIQTAIDTAGNVPWEHFLSVIPLTDLFLYDLKHTDDEIHKKGTGVSNRMILANLEKLLEFCPEKVIIRIPIIPGFNDDEQSLASIKRWLTAHHRPKQIEPLAYHKLGEHKSEALGQKPFTAVPPDTERMQRIKNDIENMTEELS